MISGGHLPPKKRKENRPQSPSQQSAASIITSSDDNLSDCILVAGAMSPALAVRQEVEDISRSKRQPAIIYKKEVLRPRDLSDLLNPLHQHHYLHHHHRHLLPPPPPAAAALQVSGRSTGRQRRDKENARVLGLSLDTVQMVAALPMEEFNVMMLYVLTPPFS